MEQSLFQTRKKLTELTSNLSLIKNVKGSSSRRRKMILDGNLEAAVKKWLNKKEEKKSYIVLATSRSYHREDRCNKKGKKHYHQQKENNSMQCGKNPTNHTISKTSVREKTGQLKTVQQSASIQGKEWFSSACLIPMRHVVFITN